MNVIEFLKNKKKSKGMLGAVPSPRDERDFPLAQLSWRLTKEDNLEPVCLPKIKAPVFNQGQSSQCVACSLALVKFFIENFQTHNKKIFSTNYIYGNREEDDAKGEGMYPREAIKTLRNFGVPPMAKDESFLSYEDAVSYYKGNKEKLDRKAKPYRISSFYALKGEREIKNSVKAIGAVTGMFPTYDCLFNTGSDGIVHYTKSTYNYGYHEMTIVGWDDTKKSWIIQNSWGTEWGKDGLAYIPYTYPIAEAWAIVDNVIEDVLHDETDEDCNCDNCNVENN